MTNLELERAAFCSSASEIRPVIGAFILALKEHSGTVGGITLANLQASYRAHERKTRWTAFDSLLGVALRRASLLGPSVYDHLRLGWPTKPPELRI
jgi:hypothetical protein